MRGGEYGGPLIEYGGCTYKRRRDTEVQRGGHVKTEDWSDASTHQETSNIAGKPPEARKRQEKIPYKLQRE